MSDSELIKIVIAGPEDTGKTSLRLRLTNGIFKSMSIPTIGVEYENYEFITNDEKIKLQIWDTAGQARFRSVAKAYFRRSLGAILAFDITNRRSFDELNIWINDLRNLCAENAYIILVGNKSDLEEDRAISRVEAENFANQKGIQYFETSAKSNVNVETIFKTLGEEIIRRIKPKSDTTPPNKTEKVDEKKDAESDNEFSLSPTNLYDFPFEKYKNDFTFILNGRQYKTSRIVADLLSPTIREMHLVDPTVDEFNINTETVEGENEGENYFTDFLKLCSFKPTIVDDERRKYYAEYFFALGNINEYFRMQRKSISLKDIEKVISNFEVYVKFFNKYTKWNECDGEIDDDLVSFVASHFYEVDQERLKKLPLRMIERIVFNENLTIIDEDSLINFILNLYEKDSSFSILFSAVCFDNVSNGVLEAFIEKFVIDDINTNIWRSICYRLVSSDKEKVDDINSKKRYHKNE